MLETLPMPGMLRAEYVLSVLGGKRLIWCGRCRGWWSFDPKGGKPYCHGCQLYSDEAAEILRALAQRGPSRHKAKRYRDWLGKELKGRRRAKAPPLVHDQPSSSPDRAAPDTIFTTTTTYRVRFKKPKRKAKEPAAARKRAPARRSRKSGNGRRAA